MPLTVELGQELTRNGAQFRVVRITQQDSLFESEDLVEVISEHLLELKSQEGKISFEVLSSERKPYQGPQSSIKAPDPIQWRKD